MRGGGCAGFGCVYGGGGGGSAGFADLGLVVDRIGEGSWNAMEDVDEAYFRVSWALWGFFGPFLWVLGVFLRFFGRGEMVNGGFVKDA